MIYFLINNDYQLLNAQSHLAELKQRGMSAILIEVPHNLNAENRGAGFTGQYRFASPLTKYRWLYAWPRYFLSALKIRKSIKPREGDILFFYTEYELINQFIAIKFKNSKGLVYLVEDGGFATYIPFSVAGSKNFTAKEVLMAAMTRCLPGLRRTVFHKVNGHVFPWLPDDMIDGLVLYNQIPLVRDIRKYFLKRIATEEITPQPGRVIFLNECMYDHYQTADQYMLGLDQILRALAQGFQEVLFKFHPRENSNWINSIRILIETKYPTMHIIDDKKPVESLLADYRPEVVASYFSAALLSVVEKGVEPLYLYNLFDEIASQEVFQQTSKLLQEWNYNFVDSFKHIRSGYQSNISFDTLEDTVSIADIAQALQTVCADGCSQKGN